MLPAYVEPELMGFEQLQTLTSADISRLFKRSDGWFDHSRVRADLRARGFPEPIAAGRWSAVAVRNWMVNPQPKPAKKRRRGGKRGNGYAEP